MQKFTPFSFLNRLKSIPAASLSTKSSPDGKPSARSFVFRVENMLEAPSPESGAAGQVEAGHAAIAAGAPLGRSCKLQVNQYMFSKIKPHLDPIWGNLIVNFGKTPHSLLLNSSSHGEGVSLVAESLCLYLAQEYGYKVLYVYANGGMNSDTKLLSSAVSDAALNEVLFEGRALCTLIMPSNVSGLSFLPFAHSDSKLVQASISQHPEMLRTLLEYTRQHFDVVIFDSQPVFQAPWTVSIAQYLDAVLLVCSYAVSRREVVRSCIETFASGGVKVHGMILNERRYPVPAQLYRLIK